MCTSGKSTQALSRKYTTLPNQGKTKSRQSPRYTDRGTHFTNPFPTIPNRVVQTRISPGLSHGAIGAVRTVTWHRSPEDIDMLNRPGRAAHGFCLQTRCFMAGAA